MSEPTFEDILASLHRLFAGVRERLQARENMTGEEALQAFREVIQDEPLLIEGDATEGETGTEWFERIAAAVSQRAATAEALRPSAIQPLSAETFPGAWPFTLPEGVLLGHAGGAIMFGQFDGPLYAVNGHARELGALDVDPIWARTPPGSLAPRVSLADINAAGQTLVEQAKQVERTGPDSPR